MVVQRKRWGFTSAEKAELWDRWQRGESLSSIGRAFGNHRHRFMPTYLRAGGSVRQCVVRASETRNFDPKRPFPLHNWILSKADKAK